MTEATAGQNSDWTERKKALLSGSPPCVTIWRAARIAGAGRRCFERKIWRRGEGSEDLGGGEMSMLQTFEKAGVHISTVYGAFSEDFRGQVAGAADDPRFWAAGISVIIHPRNPNAPTAHMNTRMVLTTKGWFGGGGDLTPVLDAQHVGHDDTRDFHAAYKAACDRHDPGYYDNLCRLR